MANSSNDGETLETLLNRATNPLNREDDWEFIMDFCDRVKSEIEGVSVATKLLLYKIHSPQEREALQAVTVLEACVKNCGELFQNAVGKKSFVDKVVTQIQEQHVKKKNSDKVQQNLIKLLYIWSVALKDQKNLKQGYEKLKQQGIVPVDPECDPGVIATLQPVKSKEDIFSTSDDKRAQLQKLLKSRNPHDHKAANLLIKNALKEDESKMEREQQNLATLEEVKNNASLLSEMLGHFKPGLSVQADLDIMKELYGSCLNLRPILYRSAASTSDESTLADILRTNDLVTKVMKQYEQATTLKSPSAASKTQGNISEPAKKESLPVSEDDAALIDISGLSLNASSSNISSINHADNSTASTSQHSALAFVKDADDTLLDLRSSPSELSNNSTCLLDYSIEPTPSNCTITSDLTLLDFLPSQTDVSVKKESTQPQENLLEMCFDEKSYSAPFSQNGMKASQVDDPYASLINLNTAEPYGILNPSKPTLHNPADDLALIPNIQNTSLDNLHVSLEMIRPSSFPAVVLYDKNNLRVLLYFAKDHASPIRTDTLVTVVTFISNNMKSLRNISLQVSVPKIMKVKLLVASGTDLPPFNPLISSTPLTQVMIISNSTKEEVKLRFKLDYQIEMQTPISEMGIVGGFPARNQWGSL